jgi:hypothetical protein
MALRLIGWVAHPAVSGVRRPFGLRIHNTEFSNYSQCSPGVQPPAPNPLGWWPGELDLAQETMQGVDRSVSGASYPARSILAFAQLEQRCALVFAHDVSIDRQSGGQPNREYNPGKTLLLITLGPRFLH